MFAKFDTEQKGGLTFWEMLTMIRENRMIADPSVHLPFQPLVCGNSSALDRQDRMARRVLRDVGDVLADLAGRRCRQERVDPSHLRCERCLVMLLEPIPDPG